MPKTVIRDGLFASYDRLLEIEVCGHLLTVPEHNSLLRGFQFVQIDRVSAGNYCWNGDCTNCLVWLKPDNGPDKCVLACRTAVKDGLVVTRLSPELETALLD